MAINALTHTAGGIIDCIATPVELKNIFTGAVISTKGIWDTGAQNSVITKKTAESLGLVPVTKTFIRGVNSTVETNVYFVNITLNNKSISIDAQVTECQELSADNSVGMLIGMNIISMGDFAITNFGGKTVMTYRRPSLQVIDFVKGINTNTPIVSSKIPSRNDPCNCGSGKKYKHCCGK